MVVAAHPLAGAPATTRSAGRDALDAAIATELVLAGEPQSSGLGVVDSCCTTPRATRSSKPTRPGDRARGREAGRFLGADGRPLDWPDA